MKHLNLTRQLPADKEQVFIDSIVDVGAFRYAANSEKEHGAFNGWGTYRSIYVYIQKQKTYDWLS